MQELIRRLLAELGEDPAREGLRDTPKRVEKALKFLTSGYAADIDDVINNALFSVDYSEMVIVKDIDFYSLCEHHLLPFFGRVHVAYVPNGKVVGLSKIPRLVGINVFDYRDEEDKYFVREILDKAGKGQQGPVDYKWIQPLTRQMQAKSAWFRQVGQYVITYGDPRTVGLSVTSRF